MLDRSSKLSSISFLLLTLVASACNGGGGGPSTMTVCTETCEYSGDGECDDGGEGSSGAYCALGSDCLDCGSRTVSMSMPGDDAGPAPVDSGPSFPAVCQEFPLQCPDGASLEACEAGAGSAFSSCEYLPITVGCATAGCPSRSQTCRTAETAAGYCTHSCVNDDDCPVEGSGSARCVELVPGVMGCSLDV